jgi:hypothetical protein
MTTTARSIKRSLWTLCIASIVSWFALVWNAPSPKETKFEVLCETVIVPTQVSLDLAQGGTELESITAHDFYGSFSDASTIRFAKGGQGLRSLPTSTLTLSAEDDRNSPASYFHATRQGAVGKALLQIGPQVELSGTESAGLPSLSLVSHQKGDVRLAVSSKSFAVEEGNRYILPEIQTQAVDSFKSTLQGRDLVSFQFSSGDRPRPLVSLSFQLHSPDELQLLDSPIRVQQNVSLSFNRSLNPFLRFDNQVAAGVTSDRKVDLVIQFNNVTIEFISLVSKPEKSDVAMLRITGTGSAKSVRQGGHELLPTMISEMLDRPVAERTGWLILFGALAAVFLKAVDHALSVILEYFIPKG